jgi:hypothetical protein
MLAPLAAPLVTAQPAVDEWFSQLQAGVWVKVEGEPRDGVLQAAKIKILATALDESECSSEITGVDAEARSLQTKLGVTILASHRTDVQGIGSERIPFASLKPGDRVECEGQVQRDGGLLADEIDLERPQHDRDVEEDEITGRIESVDAARHRMVLLGVPVQVDAKTRNLTPKLE